ncbi:histidine kinase [Leptospira wolffii]|uniref:sensor histidine kinase n=1 Tax=Leptospira wolffii TaxID=409998 RepID=UPI001082A17C|nr:sensor histidine kinase [Leptospira wolffii]TGK55925.1 histidine kinase [Leptospira wolffii]TGK71971.1 histidine kinase [Leptospira wolffii]TGK78625.1 histidine kinase [Leptospira wolffii]TGL27548.1 histidine kinase [Leptospira wolffii]
MQSRPGTYYVLLFACILVFACGCSAPKSISAKKGSLDLSALDFDSHQTIRLDGEWEYYPNRFLVPDAGKKGKNLGDTRYVSVPSVWDLETNGKTGHGFASYRLQIRGKKKERLALYLPDIGTSYVLYVNGSRIAGVGGVGETAESSSASYNPLIAILPNDADLDIILHVSNFSNRWGGLWNSIVLGDVSDITQYSNRKFGVDLILFAVSSCMFVYHLFLFFFRRQERAPLYFSVYCFWILLRVMSTGERILYSMFSFFPWDFLNRIEYLSIYLAGAALYSFLHRLCPTEFWRRFGFYLNLPLFVSSAAVVLLPNEYYTLTLTPLSYYVLATTAPIWAVLLGYGVWKRNEGALFLFIAYIIDMVLTYNDIFLVLGFLDTTYLIPYALVFLVVSYSLLISKLFSASFERSRILSLRMKSLVSSTREIMLSTSHSEAAGSTLGILHQNFGIDNNAYIYIAEGEGAVWTRYTISTFGNPIESENIAGEELERNYGVPWERISEPFWKEGRMILPILSDSHRLLLSLPSSSRLEEESQMDWLQGIAYALFLSIQNVSRQDREKLAILGELSAEIVHDIGHHIMLIQQNLKTMETGTAEEMIPALQRTKKETDALTNLSYDILDFSKNRIILDLRSVDILKFFQEVERDLYLYFRSMRGDFELRCKVSASGEFKLDPLRIRRLIFNLAKNSVEAIEGDLDFSVLIEKESEVLYMIFQDNGPGFSEEAKSMLFHSSLDSKKPHGAGLGLSIVRKIAVAHGGEVLVDSEPGKGSRFTVLLPS